MRGQIPFLPPAKTALEGALREAQAMKHRFIGTEHLLLGLTREEATAAPILGELGASPDAVRQRVLAMLSGE